MSSDEHSLPDPVIMRYNAQVKCIEAARIMLGSRNATPKERSEFEAYATPLFMEIQGLRHSRAPSLAASRAERAARRERAASEFAQERKEAEEEERREEKARAAKHKRDAANAEATCGDKPSIELIVSQAFKALRDNAHNPASVSLVGCTIPELTTACWRTVCRYRANNRIGALNLFHATILLKNGNVILLKEQK